MTFDTYYVDVDGDGFGDVADPGISLCADPNDGSVTNNLDCDDNNGAINPDATEICNGVDDDCDGAVDEGLIFDTYYVDLDGDGFGDTNDAGVSLCADPNDGSVTNNLDCDDDNDGINPNATEICNGVDDDCDGAVDEDLIFVTYYVDVDGDGFGDAADPGISLCADPNDGSVTNNLDCDDDNDGINPNAIEICNGVDDDCDGAVDEDLIFETYYVDVDGDGFGDVADPGVSLCADPNDGSVTNNLDCDDDNDGINPDATEICNGIDDDCDGAVDEGLIFDTYYVDVDGDGFGDVADPGISLCADPNDGSVTNNLDCDDDNDGINPDATEICNGVDDDCDGAVDEDLIFETYYVDVDGDGFGDVADPGISLCADPNDGSVTNNLDCDDDNDGINPNAIEVCNGVDDDCDGAVDEDLIFETYYVDVDGDGFGDTNDAGVSLCADPNDGSVTNNLDCDDNNGAINPNAIEVCNGVDDDCDGAVDDGLIFDTYYVDADGDGFGDSADLGISLCADPNDGSVTNNLDCDDDNDGINPDAIEVCNGIDDDCDGAVDEDLIFETYYVDVDGDGFGDTNDAGVSLCADPNDGSVTNNFDCDDDNDGINPDAIEICNGVDDDCDGAVDEGLIFDTYYVDVDGDGFGDTNDAGISLCADPNDGSVTNNLDCDDDNDGINPNATEICNGVDDDCDGAVDEDLIFDTYYVDLDGDGFGDSADLGISLCADPNDGSVTNNLDCDDDNDGINPDATEVCNGVDDDCDGAVDEDLIFDTYYVDVDGDGFGDVADPGISLCADPADGSVTNNLDCDDNNGAINPNAIEVCNGVDDDCDGTIDETCDCEGVLNGDALPGTLCYNGTDPGTYGSDCVCTSFAVGNIDGSVNWEAACGTRDVIIEIYNLDFPALNDVFYTTVDANGDFSSPDFPVGTYDILITVEGYLSKLLAAQVIGSGPNALDFSPIFPGDLNASNSVNILDVSIVGAAYGSVFSDPNYNYLADFNCDGLINIVDISFINISFGMTGDSVNN